MPLSAHAETVEAAASARATDSDKAPIATAVKTPVQESAPLLPKSLFGFDLDFWRSAPEKTAPVAPTPPTPPETPAPKVTTLVAPAPPAHIIPMAPQAPKPAVVAKSAPALPPSAMPAPVPVPASVRAPATPLAPSAATSPVVLPPATLPGFPPKPAPAEVMAPPPQRALSAPRAPTLTTPTVTRSAPDTAEPPLPGFPPRTAVAPATTPAAPLPPPVVKAPAAPTPPVPVSNAAANDRLAPSAPPPQPALLTVPPTLPTKAQITPLAPVETALPVSPLQDATQPATALRAIADPSQEIVDAFPRIKGIDLTTPANDLWQRMRNGFSMPNLDSPLVADRQAWYLNRPELLKSVLNRSRRYLFFIVGELEKRGMPTELALLPMVESSYNPMAYSPARASGLWQFIPSTGKNYRLQQDWWHDQRRDIIASTGAALDYLQNIYEMHGDWHLALASYNWGEAAVARAIAKNQAKHLPTDYLHINMPQETRYYVPKLQALKNIIAQPELFGLKIEPIPNQPYFDTVDKTANMDVSVAAKLAEMPLNEFLALNPSYNRPVMPASKGSPIVLPADKVQTFLANLERHEADEKPLSNWSTYTLKKGERLDKVAARYHMSVARLKQINGLGARSRIVPGNTLLVPGKGMQLASESLPEINPPQTAEAPPPRAKGRHVAKRGGRTPHVAAKGRTVRHAASGGAKRSVKASGGKAGGSKKRRR